MMLSFFFCKLERASERRGEEAAAGSK